MNCRKGDLAVIVRATHPENIGALVEVIAEGIVGGRVTRPHWRVRAVDRYLKVTFERTGGIAHAREGYAFDDDLRRFVGRASTRAASSGADAATDART
jgi:hypothetical protein